MTYRLYDTAQGSFCICWDTCCRMIKSYHRARFQQDFSEEVRETQSGLLNPLSWGLPDLYSVSVDWPKVGKETAAATMGDAFKLGAFATFSTGGVDALVRELKRMQLETRRRNELFQSSMKRASERSMAEMDKSVATYQALADGARMVRDTSGSILVACGTAATGGAAGAALLGAGAGTALKGYGKFQDTGSYGSAAIEVAQNLVFVVVPAARGVPLAGGQKVVKVLVSVSAETAKALFEGKSIGDALTKGAIALPAALAGEVSKKVLTPIMNRVAVPVLGKIITSQPEILRKLPVELAKKLIESKTKDLISSAVSSSDPHPGMRPAIDDPVVDALTFEDDLLLKFAVIDMAKGIGWSWW